MADPFHCFCTHAVVEVPGAPGGPLAGLRFAAKDNFDVAGHVTGAGSPDWLNTHGPATRTAPAVELLIRNGATLVGKTQMDELAFSLAGQNAHYGTPINPRAPDRIPGGSSSGSAVAIAAGLVDFALGTDTAGSVRVPAGNCGVIGFRPTQGRIPLEGVVPFSPSFDTVGWFAAKALVLRQVGQVLMPGRQLLSAPKRLLVVDDAFAIADAEVRDALQPLLARVEAVVGPAEHVQIGADRLESWVEQFNVLRGAEVRASLGEWIDRVQPRFGPSICERFALTRSITPEAVRDAQVARGETLRYLDELLAEDAVLCLPTAPLVPPLLSSPDTEMARYRSQTMKLTTIATIGGLPQISLPLADRRGAPVGLSLLAGRDRDATLWDLALRLLAFAC